MTDITYLDDQERVGRYQPGLNWGGKRRILVRRADGQALLFIVEGHYARVGARGFGREYHPASVWLWAEKSWRGWAGHESEQLSEGRVNVARLHRDHGVLIDRVFACRGLSECLDLRRTIVVSP